MAMGWLRTIGGSKDRAAFARDGNLAVTLNSRIVIVGWLDERLLAGGDASCAPADGTRAAFSSITRNCFNVLVTD
jgi:hypothetical protein